MPWGPTRAAAAAAALFSLTCARGAAANDAFVYWDCPGSCSTTLSGRTAPNGAPSSQPLTGRAVSVGTGCNASDFSSAGSGTIAVATQGSCSLDAAGGGPVPTLPHAPGPPGNLTENCTFDNMRLHAYLAGFSALVYVVADPAAVPMSGRSALPPDTALVVQGPTPASPQGVSLSIVLACNPGDCGTHGMCLDDQCHCVDGYSGPRCSQEPTYPCGQSGCGDHGRCEDRACTCVDGYSGDHCDTPPSKPPRLSVRPADGVTITVDTTSSPRRGKSVLAAFNVGGSTLHVSPVDASAAKWLSVSPAALSLGAGATGDFHLEADASTLEPGTYQCLLALSDNAGTDNTDVPVTLIVTGVRKHQRGPGRGQRTAEQPFDSWSAFWAASDQAAFLPGFLVGAGTVLALGLVALCCRPLCRFVVRVWATLSGRQLQHLEGNVRFERVKGTDTDEDEEAALAGGRRQNEGGGGDQARSSDQGGGEPEGGTAAASAEFKSAGPVSEAPAPAQSHGSDRGLEMHEMAGTQARWAGSAGDVETLILHPSPDLAPSQLEAKWQEMGGNSMLWGFTLARVPRPGELEAALAASNIMCLASGEVEDLLKYYFFAEQRRPRTEPSSPQVLFLLELSVSKHTCHLTAVLKGERMALVPQLRDIVHRALAPLGP